MIFSHKLINIQHTESTGGFTCAFCILFNTLSAEETDTLRHEELFRKAVFTFERTDMLPVFTTPEKAGVSGVFMRMTSFDWISLAV